MRNLLTIVEAYSAGGYSAALWRRWWGNDQTGAVLPVDLHDDHDAYLFAHLDEFFTTGELQQLPDPDDDTPYDTDPEDEIQNARDEILIAAYDKGWNAIIYDGNNRHLSLRTTRREPNLRGFRRIIDTIMQDTPIVSATLDMAEQTYQLDATTLTRFVKFGRLPR